MSECRRPRPTSPAVSRAVLFAFAVVGAAGCREDRIAADAHRTLGTQLGSAPRSTSSAGRGADTRQAASVDDLAAARRYLEATLRLDPGNAGALAALSRLGGAPDVGLAFPGMPYVPGPVAGRAFGARARTSFPKVAFGDVGAIGADVADAVRPWARVPTVSFPIGRSTADSGRSTIAVVATRPATPHRVAGTATAIASPADSHAVADGDVVRTASTAAPHTHRRTWPWTRMQRWLVAKGIAGGAGAGVVVGAIVGNVPGAILAGSLGGGALGFKKATKVGPAAPYPSARDSATFDAEKRARDAERTQKAKPDSSARVAVAHR